MNVNYVNLVDNAICVFYIFTDFLSPGSINYSGNNVKISNKQNKCYFYISKRLIERKRLGNCLAVRRLRLSAFIVMGLDLIPGWGTEISQAMQQGP